MKTSKEDKARIEEISVHGYKTYFHNQVDKIKEDREMSDSNLMCDDNIKSMCASLEITAQEQIGAAECTPEAWLSYFAEPCMDRILDSDLNNETVDEVFANSNIERNEKFTRHLLRRCCADITTDYA